MVIKWNEKIYKWYAMASAYTGYDRELKKILLMMIPEGSTLCDMGCGAAMIDFEMQDVMKKITCVDVDADVIASVRKEILRRGTTNIEAVCSDGMEIEGRWDTVMAIFHSRNTETILHYLDLARDRLILVTRNSRMSRVGIEKYKELACYDKDTMPGQLKRLGLPFTHSSCELEHGQPFKSLDEAEDYISTFTGMTDRQELADYLETILVKTGDMQYPYYMPKKKKFEVFCITK